MPGLQSEGRSYLTCDRVAVRSVLKACDKVAAGLYLGHLSEPVGWGKISRIGWGTRTFELDAVPDFFRAYARKNAGFAPDKIGQVQRTWPMVRDFLGGISASPTSPTTSFAPL